MLTGLFWGDGFGREERGREREKKEGEPKKRGEVLKEKETLL